MCSEFSEKWISKYSVHSKVNGHLYLQILNNQHEDYNWSQPCNKDVKNRHALPKLDTENTYLSTNNYQLASYKKPRYSQLLDTRMTRYADADFDDLYRNRLNTITVRAIIPLTETNHNCALSSAHSSLSTTTQSFVWSSVPNLRLYDYWLLATINLQL